MSRYLCSFMIGLCLLARVTPARAVPAFAMQTGQPCAACHVGAFGPQLKAYGRDFKMNGYLASDSSRYRLPIAISGWMSLTRTDKNQPAPAAPHFATNDNIALDQVSLYYAGRITRNVGAFIQVTYDGVADQLQSDNTDIRYANGDGELFDQDMVWGIDANNSPTVTDVWNSVPAWGFPYNGSALAPGPAASTLVDGALGQHVAGLGSYIDWNDLVYLETDLYRGLGYDVLNATGQVPITGTDRVEGEVPYGRIALEQQLGRSDFELGGYGLHAAIDPGGGFAGGRLDHYTDLAADANYQFIVNPRSVTSDMLSAHATYIHESGSLDASADLLGLDPDHDVEEFRADASYSIGATWTPTIQYFQVHGNTDPIAWGTPNGSPNSSGYIAELAYVPWGKPDSPFSWGNLRLAVQYIGYLQFNGTGVRASDNNDVYFSIWGAAHF